MLSGMKGSRPLALAASLLLSIALLVACDEPLDVDDSFVPRSPTPGDATVEASASGDPSPVAAAASPTPAATPNADGVYVGDCGDIHVPLDKVHRLAEDCEPADLVAIPEGYAYGGSQRVVGLVLDPLLALLDAAAAEGHALAVVSSYRSYETQRNTFQYHVDAYGFEAALRVSARPGHSEHQLGTTVDFSSAAVGYELVATFGQTPEGGWLAEHAHEFGFVLSYPEGKEHVTGYAYEPWHFRWVGRAMAADVRASDLTIGQFLLR